MAATLDQVGPRLKRLRSQRGVTLTAVSEITTLSSAWARPPSSTPGCPTGSAAPANRLRRLLLGRASLRWSRPIPAAGHVIPSARRPRRRVSWRAGAMGVLGHAGHRGAEAQGWFGRHDLP